MKDKPGIATLETECDLCRTKNHPVLFDVPHPSGPWCYACEACYSQFKSAGTEVLGFRLPTSEK